MKLRLQNRSFIEVLTFKSKFWWNFDPGVEVSMKVRFWSRSFDETSILESKFRRNFDSISRSFIETSIMRVEVSSKLRFSESKFRRNFDETSTAWIEVSSKLRWNFYSRNSSFGEISAQDTSLGKKKERKTTRAWIRQWISGGRPSPFSSPWPFPSHRRPSWSSRPTPYCNRGTASPCPRDPWAQTELKCSKKQKEQKNCQKKTKKINNCTTKEKTKHVETPAWLHPPFSAVQSTPAPCASSAALSRAFWGLQQSELHHQYQSPGFSYQRNYK